jgi:hypothetical protein
MASSSLLDAFSILSPEYWWGPGGPTLADFKQKLTVLTDTYGKAVSCGGQDYPPLVSSSETGVQAGYYFQYARTISIELSHKLKQEAADRERAKAGQPARASAVTADNYHEWEVSSTQSDDDEPELPTSYFTTDGDMRPTLSRFWAAMCSSPIMEGHVSEFAALARILITLVPGSVEEERLFSAMNFLKHKLRSRLTTGLVPAVRVFTDRRYKLSAFPIKEATNKWLYGMDVDRRNV